VLAQQRASRSAQVSGHSTFANLRCARVSLCCRNDAPAAPLGFLVARPSRIFAALAFRCAVATTRQPLRSGFWSLDLRESSLRSRFAVLSQQRASRSARVSGRSRLSILRCGRVSSCWRNNAPASPLWFLVAPPLGSSLRSRFAVLGNDAPAAPLGFWSLRFAILRCARDSLCWATTRQPLRSGFWSLRWSNDTPLHP